MGKTKPGRVGLERAKRAFSRGAGKDYAARLERLEVVRLKKKPVLHRN
jgi:hypothetical protein